MTENITLMAAVFAGVISFLSPCVLPLVPAYISYITGLSVDELRFGVKETEVSRRLLLNSLALIIGFSAVFIAMGATATFIGRLLTANLALVSKIAGAVLVVFGLHLMGVFRVRFLNYEKRLRVQAKPVTLIGSFLVGVAFAAGWSPCIGPILGAILAIAASKASVVQGVILLSFYSLGLAIPFFLTAVATNALLKVFKQVKQHFRTVEIISGVFLISVGVMMFFNVFTYLSSYINQWFPWLQNIG
jgi:cytochrome c-type biogenesis protein